MMVICIMMFITWKTEKEDVSEWGYVTVADLGIIGPYLAENYYTFIRKNSFVSVADKILKMDRKSGSE